MLTSKQRAKLRSIAATQDTVLYIGKGGITDTVVTQAKDALAARELIKVKTHENAPVSARETAYELAEKTGAEVVTVIGTKAVLYLQNKKEPKIRL